VLAGVATELLDYIDWVLAKLAEHAAIREKGLSVLVDNFGPNDACYENGSRSARTGHGDPPRDYDVAHSFFVGEAVLLDRIDIGLALRRGSGDVEITLIRGDDLVPSDDAENVVEQWVRKVTAPPNALEVLHLSPSAARTLGPHEVY
jgi:hypothetical protein